MSKKDFSRLYDEPAYIKLTNTKDIVSEVDILCPKTNNYLISFDSLITNSESIYLMTLEKAAGFEVSKRVQILRVIADEVIRVSSHLFNLSILAHMINEHALMSKTIAVRSLINDIKEIFWENKIDSNISILCGTKYDIDSIKNMKILKKIKELESKIDSLIYTYENSDKVLQSTTNVGILSKEEALEYGMTGPIARGSGINNDIRINAPYSIYKELNLNLIIKQNGDVHSRSIVRCLEIKESISIIKQALNMLPDNKLIVYKKLDLSEVESSLRIEAPRGELFCYLKTDDKANIIRKNLRVPSLMNWEVLKIVLKDNKTSNVPLILNSFDPCLCM
ncbi:MAG: ech hydrogenase subunit E [Sulfurimonas sp.]|jgi:ech hydrogenase subunit E